MKILEREIGTIEYQENQTRTLPLPRNYAYRKLYLKLVAELTLAAGSAGTPKDSCPAQLISSIEIRANGRDVVKKFDLETLHRMNHLRYGVRPRVDGLPAGFGADSDVAVDVHAIIDFEMWRAIRPIDTLLDSAGMATLELIVTFGTGTDVMTDAYNGTVAIGSATLYVAALEAVGVPAGTTFMVNKEYQIRSIITAASNNHQIPLPVGNLYRSFVIKTHSDGVQVDTILNNIQLKAGTEVFKNRIAGFLQMDNRLELGLVIPDDRASLGTTDNFYLEHILEGYYLLEFVKDGHLTEALDTSKLSSLELLLDVNAPGTVDVIDVYPVELVLPVIRKA